VCGALSSRGSEAGIAKTLSRRHGRIRDSGKSLAISDCGHLSLGGFGEETKHWAIQVRKLAQASPFSDGESYARADLVYRDFQHKPAMRARRDLAGAAEERPLT
jgi:hypothetical protein